MKASCILQCMGNPAGVKRNFDAMEKRRMQAAKLLKQGIHEAEVARQVGVHRQSVNRWARQLNKSGVTGLKKACRAGRKSRLSSADLNAIRKALKRGSETMGYKTGLWTTPRVADLIEQKCGIRYHSVHVGKLLRKLGWSCRWLIIRASNRDEDTARRWKKRRRTKHKKGSIDGTNHTLRRGKKFVRTTAWLPDIVSSNASSDVSVSHQLGNNLGGGYYPEDSLLPTVTLDHPESLDSGIPYSSDAAYPWRSFHFTG